MKSLVTAGRNALLVMLYLSAARTRANAQTVEITPFAGYETSGSHPLDNPTDVQALRADGGNTYGTFFDYAVTKNIQAEFLWASNPTTYSQQETDTGQYTQAFNTRIDQYQFGALYLLRDNTNTWRPYLAGSLGFTHDSNHSDNVGRTTFGATLGVGIKYRLSKHIGIRGDARFMPTHGSEGPPYTLCSRIKDVERCSQVTAHNYLQRYNFTLGLIIRPKTRD